MKKLIHSVLTLAMAVFTMASCANDDVLTESVQVTFTAKLPESIHSRADASFGTGEYVNKLYCAIYEKKGDASYTFVKSDKAERSGDGFSFSPYLAKDNTYKIAFWAMKDRTYEITPDLMSVSIPSDMTCNDGTKEAFAGVSEDVIVGSTNGSPINVELKRPFALLNIATTMSQAQMDKKEKMAASVTLTCAGGIVTSYNVFTGEVTCDQSVNTLTFSAARILGTECEKDNVNYVRLASCYVMPSAKDEEVTVHILVKEGDTTIGDLTEENIPLTENYSTNLYGKILTGSAGTTVATN